MTGIDLVIGPAIGEILVGRDPIHPNFHLPGLVAALASTVTLVIAFITLHDLRTFYQAYNIHLGDLEEVFYNLDLNQDGYIFQEEFRTLFTQFLYSDDIQAPGNWIFGSLIPSVL